LQLLFEGSEENGGVEGLGIIPGRVTHFDTSLGLPVPHIGWNTLEQRCNCLPQCLWQWQKL
jgi:glutamine amidotransferase/cyclase